MDNINANKFWRVRYFRINDYTKNEQINGISLTTLLRKMVNFS